MAFISCRIVAFAALTLATLAGAAVAAASTSVCGWASKGLRRAGKKDEKAGEEDGARQAQPSGASRTQEGCHSCVVRSSTTSKDAQAAQGLIAAIYTALTQLAIRRALCFRATFTGFNASPSVGKASAVVALDRALRAAKSSSSTLATQARCHECALLAQSSGSVSSRKALPRSLPAGPVVASRPVPAACSTQAIMGRVVCGFTLGSGSRTEVCVSVGYNMRTGLELGVSVCDRLSGVRETIFVTYLCSVFTARDLMTTLCQAMVAPLSPKQAARHVTTLCAALRSVGLTLPTTTHTDNNTHTYTTATLTHYLPNSTTPVPARQAILCSVVKPLTVVAAAPSIMLVQPQGAVITARVAAVRGGADGAARAAWEAAVRRAGSTLVAEASLIAGQVSGLALCTVTPAPQVKGVCKEWRPYALKGAPVAAATTEQAMAAVVPASEGKPAAAASATEAAAAVVQETATAAQAAKPGKLSKGQKKNAKNKAKRAAGAAEQAAVADNGGEQPAATAAASEPAVAASGVEQPVVTAATEPAPAAAAAVTVTADQASCAAEQPAAEAQAKQSDQVAVTEVSTPVVQASKHKGKKGGKTGKVQQATEPAVSTAVAPAVPAEEASPASDTAVAAGQPAADSRNPAAPRALPASSDAGQGAVAAAETCSKLTAPAAVMQPAQVPLPQVATAAAAEPVTAAAGAEQPCLAPAAAVPAAKQAARKKKSKVQKVSLADLVAPAPASTATAQLRSQPASDIWATAGSAKASAGVPVQRTQSAGAAAVTAARPAATQLLRASASEPTGVKPAPASVQRSNAASAAVTPAAPAKQQLQQRLSATGKAATPAAPAATKKVGLSSQPHQPASTVVGADFVDDWQQAKGKSRSKAAVPLGHNTQALRSQGALGGLAGLYGPQPAAATQPTGVVMIQPKKTPQAGGKAAQAVPYTREAVQSLLEQLKAQGPQHEVAEGATHEGAGLHNQGIDCFLNSVIQSLAHLPLVQRLALGVSVSKAQEQGSDILAGLLALVNEMLTANQAQPITPKSLLNWLRRSPDSWFSGRRQEDPQELLACLRMQLGPVADTFQGSYVSTLHWTAKNGTPAHSSTPTPFSELPLPITKDGRMESSLEAYMNGNTVMYKPEGYAKDITCSQKILVDKAPDHLVIQLLRFEQGSKKSTRVQCPEYLDFTKYMKGGRKVVYRLRSMIVHGGDGIHSGHYVSYSAHADGQWYLHNDGNVRRASLDEVLNNPTVPRYNNPAPYLFFYVRQDTPQVVMPAMPTQTMAAMQLGKAVAAARVPQGMGSTAVRSPRGCFNSPPPPCAPVVGGVQCAR